MSRRTQENLVAAAFLVVFFGIIYLSLDYGPRARMVPIPVAAFGAILTVIQMIWMNVRPADELQLDLLEVLTRSKRTGGQAPAKEEGQVEAAVTTDGTRGPWREAAALGLVVAFTALVLLFGPVPSIFVFTLAYFGLSRHYPWARALIYTALFTGAVYLLFVEMLQIQLYHGVLEPIFAQ